jgi:hypothetical protein
MLKQITKVLFSIDEISFFDESFWVSGLTFLLFSNVHTPNGEDENYKQVVLDQNCKIRIDINSELHYCLHLANR